MSVVHHHHIRRVEDVDVAMVDMAEDVEEEDLVEGVVEEEVVVEVVEVEVKAAEEEAVILEITMDLY